MVPSCSSKETHVRVRKQLQDELLTAVKQCQTRFGGRTELATELDPHVAILCQILESVLTHGLKAKSGFALKQVTDLVLGNADGYVMWDAVRRTLTQHELERYLVLKQVWTDRGRGRAWLRSALNEKSLERYLNSIIAQDRVATYYEDWAFIRDPEASNILINAAAGLGSILFAISIDRPELNHIGTNTVPGIAISSPEQVIEESSPILIQKAPDGRKSKKSKIISFGDNDEVTGPQLASSPSNSVNSTTTEEIKESVPPSQDVTCQEEAMYLGVEAAEEAAGALGDLDISNSDNDGDNVSVENSSSGGLRPLNNSGVGELIPVSLTDDAHSSEDSVSVPSFSEENENQANFIGNHTNEMDEDVLQTLQLEVKKLRDSLTDISEANRSLTSQLTEVNHINEQKLQESETKIQELNRENELLKHQLRKYVGAVQMLKQQEGQPSSYSESVYEQKLIQVAEMHGELMELNERLQRSVVNKEGIIRRLYLELEALRGPLDIDIHAHFISLWVPSVFLTPPPKPHHVYQVHLRISNEEWNVYRRYTQFFTLHKTIKKQQPIVEAFQFPPKKTIGNRDVKFVEERRLKLQQYLRRLLNHVVANNPALANSPSKSLLTSIVPFFGEQNEPTSQRRPSPRRSYPRGHLATTPQYGGL